MCYYTEDDVAYDEDMLELLTNITFCITVDGQTEEEQWITILHLGIYEYSSEVGLYFFDTLMKTILTYNSQNYYIQLYAKYYIFFKRYITFFINIIPLESCVSHWCTNTS
jgi:hypothetical protein